MRPLSPLSLTFLVAAALLCGCGSKISEANYYRVHFGMTEEEVEDQLGPAHEESTLTPATEAATRAGAARKQKSWRRGELVIRVIFEDGRVVGRSAVGIPGEAAAKT